MNENIHTMIGKELVLLRIEKGYSVENIVDVANLNKDTLYRYEKGKGNNFNTLAKILSVYNLDFYIFFKRIYDRMQNKREQ